MGTDVKEHSAAAKAMADWPADGISQPVSGPDSPNCSDNVASLDELSKGNLEKSGAGVGLNADGETAKRQPPTSTEIPRSNNQYTICLVFGMSAESLVRQRTRATSGELARWLHVATRRFPPLTVSSREALPTRPGRLNVTISRTDPFKDAQLAREFILAVPKELSADEQFQSAVAWANKELVASGMVAEISLHHSKSGKNPHVHILCTMRRLDGDGFSAKKATEWNDVKLLVEQRATWAAFVNEALEKAGRPERVDHRSLKDRGIDRLPEPKIGVAATAMKRRGVVEDPERFQFWWRVKMLNEVRPWAQAIERLGEVQQRGMGDTWWERSLVMATEVGKTVRDAVLDTWNTLIHARLPERDVDVPTPGREIDLSR